MRRIVADTGPLITLEKLPDGYAFIRLLYDRIVVPAAVLKELVAGQFTDAAAYVSHYGIGDLLEVSRSVEVPAGLSHLDAGEREAISLALHSDAVRRALAPALCHSAAIVANTGVRLCTHVDDVMNPRGIPRFKSIFQSDLPTSLF